MKQTGYNPRLLLWPTLCFLMVYVFIFSPGVRQSRLLYALAKSSGELNDVLREDTRFAHISSVPSNPFADSHLLIMGSLQNVDDYQSLQKIINEHVHKRYAVRYAVQIFDTSYERMYDQLIVVPNA